MLLAVLMTAANEVVDIFAVAIAVATGLLSSPIEGKRSNRAAKLVVPRPQNGSNTHAPPRTSFLKTFKGKSKGNIVKYGHTAFSEVKAGYSL